MAIYGTPLTLGGGGGGKNETLPPLLDNFKASLKKNLLSDLPSGTKIKFGRYGNSIVPGTPQIAEFDLIWVTAKNKQGTTFLVLSADTAQKQPFNAMVYDTAEPRNSVSSRKTGGNSRYIQSNIHQWLNGNVGSWQAMHPDDEFPPYSEFEKFSQRWTNEERSALQDTTWTVAKSSADGGGTENFNALFVLPSREEVGLESSNNLDIFTDDRSRIIPDHYWALRTPNSDDRIWDVSQSGSSSNWFCKKQYTIRPICCPKANTEVSAEPDSDGCYTIVVSGQSTITISADKMPVSRAADLAGAVWVYGDHIPNNVNDGTKINLTREEIVLPEEGDTDIPPISYTELERPTSTKTWTAPEDGYYKFVGVAMGGYSGTARRTVGASYNVSGGSGGSGGIVASVFKLKRGENVSLAVERGDITISYGSETANATHGQAGGSSSSEPDNKASIGNPGKAGRATGGNLINMNGKYGRPGERLERNKATIVRGGETVYEKYVSRGGDARTTIQEGDSRPPEKGTTAYIAVLKGNDSSNETLNFTAKATKTISMLPSKSKVKLGRYKGKTLIWDKGTTQSGKIVLTTNKETSTNIIPKTFQYDNREPQNPSSTIRESGNARYLWSNVRQWLNAKGTGWYKSQHTYDAPPTYQNEAGFLTDWDDKDLSVIKQGSWKSFSGVDGNNTLDTITDKIAIIGAGEIVDSFDYSNFVRDKIDWAKSPSDIAINAAYWTRDCTTAISGRVGVVGLQGNISVGGYAGVQNTGMALMLIAEVNPDTRVSENPDSDGCYTINFEPEFSKQVEKQVQWDNTKDFYARQFTYNPKKQYQTMLEGAIAYLPIMPDGQEISKLPSKSKIKLGKVNNTVLKWIVCRDTSDNQVRLILDGSSYNVLGTKQVDAPEPSNSNSDRRGWGNNRYIWSNLHQWLNTNKPANQWYVAQHGADAPPNYANQAGFLNQWTEKEIKSLEFANWTVTKTQVDGSGSETFQSRVTLASTTEIGLEGGTGGGRLDIMNSNADRDLGTFYLCRTPHPSNAHGVLGVTVGGAMTYDGARTANSVRPLCKPLSNILVSLEPDIDGDYTLV